MRPDLLSNGPYTREEVNRMEETGVLTGRWELLEGHLIDKMGQNPPHARSLHRMYGWLLRVFGNERLRNQAPVEVADSSSRFDLYVKAALYPRAGVPQY